MSAEQRNTSDGRRGRRRRRGTQLFAFGEPMLWLTGGSLGVCVLMIVGLLALVVWFGGRTFWPRGLERVTLVSGEVYLGEPTARERYRAEESELEGFDARRRAAFEEHAGFLERRLLRIENFELTGRHYLWIDEDRIASSEVPEWALTVERQQGGRFYGLPVALRVDGQAIAEQPAEVWREYRVRHALARKGREERLELESGAVGEVNARIEGARLALRRAELDHGVDSPEYRARAAAYADEREQGDAEFLRVRARVDALRAENERTQLVLRSADGAETALVLADIVRAYPANRLGAGGKLAVYGSRWREFLFDDPREMNNEGGVLPAIAGTVSMTLLMSLIAVPFGVLAALYLREYAKQGLVTSAVRVAVNNLAGVPSIVFGVFGLGFFCYIVGGGIDATFFPENLPSPTYGKGGLLWASLTLALLTLPVVIVATEEALAAVPGSMREGSFACGATRWQTIRRIVLPRAAPGIMTGMILAIARGAGEVAPLMLVGAVKLAPELPIDGQFPYVHAQRSFMHLGFHIFDLGFQSPNSEAAKPMVFTTTLLLIAIVITLNLVAIRIRTRLRRKFEGAAA